jgi:alanine racemase
MSLQETTFQPATAASGEAEAGGVLTVDLTAIAANWKRLAGMTVPVECAAVVKADAYGCGIERVVPSPISRKAIACARVRRPQPFTS